MRKLSFLLVSMAFLLLTACRSDQVNTSSNNAEVLAMIPADVMSVTQINLAQLLKKADFENFKEKEAYQKMIADAEREDPFLAKLLMDPGLSGIDIDQPVYLINGLQDGKINRQYGGAILNIKDPAQFKQMLEKADDGVKIQNRNGLSFVDNKGGNGSMLWSESHAFVGMSSRGIFEEIAADGMAGNLAENAADNKSLRKTLNKGHDIVSWTSSNGYANNKDAKMILATMGIDPDALKDNYIYSYLDFKDGEMVGRSEFDLQKKLTIDLDLFFKNKVSTDFSKYISAKDISFAMSAGLDIKGINQVLSERPQIKMFVNSALEEMNLTTEDLTRIIPGDLCLAFYNMGDGDTNTYGVFLMPTEDEEGLVKLLGVGEKMGMVKSLGAGRYALDDMISNDFNRNLNRSMRGQQVQLSVKNGMLAMTSNLELLDQIESGGVSRSDRLDSDRAALLSKHIFGGFVDLQELDLKDVDFSIPFSDIQAASNREFGDLKLNFIDTKENSLKQIMEFVNELYLKDQNQWNADS